MRDTSEYAFPSAGILGMTLRDYFAGQIKPAIIQGLMLRYEEQGYTDTYMLVEAEELTNEAVDVMIKERQQTPENITKDVLW